MDFISLTVWLLGWHFMHADAQCFLQDGPILTACRSMNPALPVCSSGISVVSRSKVGASLYSLPLRLYFFFFEVFKVSYNFYQLF